ncbi:hypothetical protein [Devosia ginsengisoli]|uniref:hypothetical protein n=1 Tax=Devosia ginsengisoli TaxID=400770 RepID=UPI0026F13A5F|nr:hypothetical protein [Devosia ginsengisoli]MCR6671471.1 hypothetical protein [Devosia ginsengisoli]
MTLYHASAGMAFPTRARLTTTLQSLDVSSAGQGAVTVPKIRMANLTSSAVAVDLEVHGASSSWSLLKGGQVPGNGAIELDDVLLGSGETLKAKAAANDAIDIHVISGVNR